MPETRQVLPDGASMWKPPLAMLVWPTPAPMMEMPLVVETLLDQLQLPAGMFTTSPSAAREIAASTSAFEQVVAFCVAACANGAASVTRARQKIRFMQSLQRFATDPTAGHLSE